MKKLLFVVLLSGLLSVLFAEDIKFAGMDWGTSEDKFKKAMVSKGYTYDQATTTSVFRAVGYKGKMAGQPSDIIALFYKDRLLKVGIMLDTDRNEMFYLFDKVYELLEKKYGYAETQSGYASPYYKGDGYEASAFSLGKAYQFCIWNQEKALLSLKISKRVCVEISYETSEFGAVVDSLNKDGDL